MKTDISMDMARIADFCRKWRISELGLFGSVLREDFHPDSDIDILVRFSPDARHGLFDWIHMQDELSAIMGRSVDLVDWTDLEHSDNYVRRNHILNHLESLYVSR